MKIKISDYPKGHKPRKIDITIDSFDTFNMEGTLAHIILPMLIQLKAEKLGVPAEFSEIAGGADYDNQTSFDFYTETHNEAFDRACEQWEDILDKMIWSFQQIVCEDYEQLYHHGKADISWEKTDEKYYNAMTKTYDDTYQMVDKNPTEHWTDYTGMQEHEKRIQEGLELFGKYYKHLWN